MTVYQLPYGKFHQEFSLPSQLTADLILPESAPSVADPYAEIISALKNPLELDLEAYRGAESVAIAINDKTRPAPNGLFLPPLLDCLSALGISPSAITFWIATGSHTPMPPEEFSRVLPAAIIENYQVRSHNIDDLDNMIHLGVTSRGTPVWVNKSYYQAKLKITIGDIEPHHFAGFSGGAKTAAIGLAGRETINKNHAMLTHPDSWIAVYDKNPLRQDINEMGDLIGIDLSLNAILNQEKQIVRTFAGRPRAVMLAGIPVALQVCSTPGANKYDLVIASAGGFPKDINFYQAQKALTHASLFAKENAPIILVAACPEGTGNRAYEEFMRTCTTTAEVFEQFSQQDFSVGPHKAFQVARLLTQHPIYLVSDIQESMVRNMLLIPSTSAQSAITLAQRNMPPGSSVAVLPYATTTLPDLNAGG